MGCAYDRVIMSDLLIELSCMQDWPGAQKIVPEILKKDEQKTVFLYPKTELEQIKVLKKHIARIQKNENLPVVLVLKELSYRQKEYLIREKIPFIVEGKQIYLPFMAVYL